ncbi:MAG: Spy/CpxP family protein refolding chaperone [Armatimonadota bacterium]
MYHGHGMGESRCYVCGQAIGHHHMGGHGMAHKGMKGMFMMPWKMMMLREELGLSDDQVDRIRDIYTNMRKHKVQLRSRIEMNKIDLQTMMMREEMNMQEIEQKIREIANLKAEKYIGWVRAMQEMRNVLTPDQRDSVKSMIRSFWKEGGMSGEGMEEEETGEASEE